MATQETDYRKLNQELEQVLEQLESDQLDIEAAIKQYQRGMELVDQLQKHLKTAKNSVKKVQTQS
jgi:exodeoxyribonuclease VII small subunit